MWVVIILCVALAGGSVAAQQAAFEVLADAEVWKTDAASRLLARNDGRMSLLGRVSAWGVVRVTPALELVALGEVQGGSAASEGTEAAVEQLMVRYFPSRRLQVDAGRVLLPIGAFARRRFSYLNPVIGAPDAYSTLYPWGLVVSGTAGVLDYGAALVTLPAVDEDYVPTPGHALRPAVSIGVRSDPAFRAGLSATRGPYLGSEVNHALRAGAAWQDYMDAVVTLDVRYSVGYVEARAEVSWSEYDVPTVADPVRGLAWYGETRVTLGPRVFVAGRFEHNRYAFIRASSTGWISTVRTQMNGEAGAGYRLGPATMVKVSYRRDYWPGDVAPGEPMFADGYALAIQLSHRLDVGTLLSGRD